MAEEQKVWNFKEKDAKRLICCGGCQVRPLLYIKVRGTDSEYHGASHYYLHAFECSRCGMIYEVERERYSYESIGDFMMPNYTSYSYRPTLIPVVQSGSLVALSKQYSNATGAIWKKQWVIKGKIEAKVRKVRVTVGYLDREQQVSVRRNQCKKEIAQLKVHDEELGSLWRDRIVRTRELLGLPSMDNLDRERISAAILHRYSLQAGMAKVKSDIDNLEVQRQQIDTSNLAVLPELDSVLASKTESIKKLESMQRELRRDNRIITTGLKK